jgi:hypothetical protein
MGLTKPRAAQIFNLDYKQSTRVVTVTNVTLTGGAPNSVDGVNLSLGDRVLVTGQTTGSQNGLYQVTTLGSGANGTWARTSDGNENGEIEAGMIVMVTEGTIYADTQWKLITDDPITIGTTALTFTQNYMANSISAGTSNVVVNSNANVTVSSAGTANVLTISNTGAFVSGVVSATGNVFANYFIGNGACLTGVVTSLANINNGNSNVTVIANSNVTVNIGGTSNVAVFSTSGLEVTGNVIGGNITTAGLITATGNVTGGNITTGGLITATGNVTGGNITTAGLVTATGTITSAANITGGNILTVGQVSATGNVSGNFFVGNGAFLTGLSAGTSNGISNGATSIAIPVSSGNIAMSVAGQANTVVINLGSLTMYGTFAGPKDLEANVTVASAVNALLIGPVVLGNAYNITVPDGSTLYVYTTD